MKKVVKALPLNVICALVVALIACVLLYVISLSFKANTIGDSLGNSLGHRTGQVAGSFQALTDYEEAYSEGKEEGLSAEDTSAEIVNKMMEIENLEVLVASVKLHDFHTIKDDYAALYFMKADAIFTVDLSKAEIFESKGIIYINLPEPEMRLEKTSDVEKLADYQKWGWTGAAKDGVEAYINTYNKLNEVSKDTLSNYPELIKAAEESAKKQVKELVTSVSMIKKEISVEFMEEVDG